MTQELKTAPVTRQQKRRKPAHSPLAVAWLSVCMVAALGCLWGWLRAGDDAGAGVGTVQATAVLNHQVEAQPPEVPAPPPAHVPLTTMPIEQVRVGQKVPAHNPDRSQVETDTPEVDPPTWRLVTMRQTTRTDSGGVDVLNIQTIQPLSLIEATGARPGAMVPVPLDVQEMADVPGPAEVLSIDPCPPIQPGPGQLVLTTVNHLNNFVFDLTVKDGTGKQETISPTGWHKFFSQTRHTWVSACELKEGEKLAGHDGDLTVTGLARRPGVHRVYNMTVQGEHVYYVSHLDLLTHNLGCDGAGIDAKADMLAEDMAELDEHEKSFYSAPHGNSLESLANAQGYILEDPVTGEPLKYGMTTLGEARYTTAELQAMNAKMTFVNEGSVAEMRAWETNQILDYLESTGLLPPYNFSIH